MLEVVRRGKGNKREKIIFFTNRTKNSTKENKDEIRLCYSKIFLWGKKESIVF